MKEVNIGFRDALLSIHNDLPIRCGYSSSASTCIARIEAALQDSAIKLGYEYVRYSYWLRNKNEGGLETSSHSINFSNFPFTWEQIYNHENMYLHDPVVRIIQDCAAHGQLVYGSWAEACRAAVANPLGDDVNQQREYAEQVTQLMLRAREHGLASGYYYAWGDHKRQIVLSLASSRDKVANPCVDDTFINTLHSVVVLVNQSIVMTQGCVHCTKSLRIEGSPPVVLSDAELRILQLYYKYRNASQKHIANESGRSIDTVNHHLRSVRRKLKLAGASGHVLATYAAELNLL